MRELPVFVINLKQATARMDGMRRQLDALSMPFIRVEAVYGRDLKLHTFTTLADAGLNARQHHVPLSLGEVGCYASHLALWERVVQEKLSAALVLEDDVLLEPQLPHVLESLLQNLEPGWDMIKLLGRQREQILRAWPIGAGRALIRYRRVPSYTGAYLVSAAGAAKLLARRRPFGRPVDVDLRYWWECDLRMYGLWPYPVHDGPQAVHSTMGNRRERPAVEARLRRLWLQVRYSVKNWREGLKVAALPVPLRGMTDE